MSFKIMFLQALFCLLYVTNSAWIDNYNTQWTEPGLTQWGSLPLGNGDLTANVWLQNIDNSSNKYNYDLYFSFSKSDSYDLTGQRLKVIQLKLSYNPPITNSTTNSFTQILYVSNATMKIQTDKYNIYAWIDVNENNLYIDTTITNNKITSYSLSTEIISWRTQNNFNVTKVSGDTLCYNPYIVPIVPDTILQHGCNNRNDATASLIFYHRNEWEQSTSGYTWNLAEQQLDFLLTDLPDPYYNLTFGALLTLPNANVTAKNTLSASYTGTSLVTFYFLTQQTDTIDQWVQQICSNNNKVNDTMEMKKSLHAHATWWDTFWNRSYIEIMPNISETYLITELYTHQRYLDALDGRGNNRSIKFNGQSFYIDSGRGPDYRDWGSSFWWQNIRQPYYNTLVAGDYDLNIPFYNQFLNQLTLIQARNKVYYNHTGGFFGETAQWNGLYQEAGWGYNCHNGTTFNPFKMNSYIRFHWVGGLELLNMLLDEFDWYNDADIIHTYLLPLSDVLLTHYIQHYPLNSTNGKLDMFPAQSLETWQCPSADRNNCVTNPTEQIAGLRVVSERLLKLPSNFGTQTQRALWANIQKIVPDIPLMKHSNVDIISPGLLLPPKESNSENTELYTVHPFRIYQFFKPNLTLAQNTYKYRRNPCNVGWCQDILDTAMLGMINETQKMVVSRANSAKQGLSWKWNGFTGHFQDYYPSLDHLEFMRTAIHYMLIQNNFDTKEIYILPTWPCQWAVRFKLHARLNTVVTVDYDGNGHLNEFIVEPSERKSDAKFVNCVS